MNGFVNDSMYSAVRASNSVISNTTFKGSLAAAAVLPSNRTAAVSSSTNRSALEADICQKPKRSPLVSLRTSFKLLRLVEDDTAAVRCVGKMCFWFGCLLFAIAVPTLQAAEDGVALGIVYDTSGSMQETVRDNEGKPAAKYVIANRALVAIAKQIQSFTTNSTTGESRRVDAGLFIFNGSGARAAVTFGKFDAAAIENWARDFHSPQGSTPLGNALNTAAQAVLRSPLTRKHVLVITDGMNTSGPTPAEVMSRLKQQSASLQQQLSIHFVAFDVDAKVFAPVKKLDATVVAALDEKQLNTQLTFILQKKILLEDEEPKKQ